MGTFAFPAVCCWIEPVGGCPKCTYSSGRRPQWAGSCSQGFPSPDWKTGILKTGTNSLLTTLLSVLVSDLLGVFFKSLFVVKCKGYLNRKINFFPMTLCLWTLMQWEFRAPMSCRLLCFLQQVMMAVAVISCFCKCRLDLPSIHPLTQAKFHPSLHLQQRIPFLPLPGFSGSCRQMTVLIIVPLFQRLVL